MNNFQTDPTLHHLQALFASCAPYNDGMIEVAFTDQRGKPNQAALFDVLDIDKALAFIKEKNAMPGVNVYTGAALRLPDTPPTERCDINDFYATTALWVDIDDGDAAESAKERYALCPPSFIVVTGRHPKKRMQLWWNLEEPENDKDKVRKALAGLCQAFSGDTSVVDPIRVMRAAGTTAWPYKDGRIQETTEFHVPVDATKTVSIDQILFLYPAPLTSTGTTNDKPRNPFTDRLDISALLEKTKEAGQWHKNMRDAIASMIGCGYSDEIIRLSCASYCIGGFTDSDLPPLINSARKKWDKPDPDDTASPPPAGEWPDPRPIQAPLLPVMPFDGKTLLPEVLQIWVKDSADRMPCPPDFIAAAAVVALGSLIGARCAIKPKAKDDWQIVPNLWGGIVGSPSAKKSPAITEAIKPLGWLVAQAIEAHEKANRDFETENMIHEAQEDALKNQLKTAAKKQKGGTKNDK